MERDFVNGTFITMGMEQRRVADAIAFCERLLKEVPYSEIKAIICRNLGDFHYFHTGDGMAARKAYEAGIDILDTDMDLVLHSQHYSAEIMKRVYSDLCEGLRPLSLSLDEYEKYALKCKGVGLRGLNATEQRGLRAIADMRNRNVPWKEDVFGRVGNYINNSGGQQAFGQVASTLSIVLCNSRSLELNRDDLNTYSIPAYMAAICNIVVDHYNECLSRSEKPNFDNYRFIFEKAIETLDGCKNSRLADLALIETYKENLRSEMKRIERQVQSASGSIPHPTNIEIDEEFQQRMEELKIARFFQDSGDSFACQFCGHLNNRQAILCEKCGRPLKNMQQNGKMPLGCLTSIMLFGVAASIVTWWWAVGQGEVKTWWLVSAIIISFFTIQPLILFINSIKNRRK